MTEHRSARQERVDASARAEPGIRQPFEPFVLFLCAIAVLTGMDVLIKMVSASYPTLQVAALRFAAGTLAMAPIVLFFRPPAPTRETLIVNGLRGLIVTCTALSFFYALRTLPLAEAVAFSFLSPLFLALLGFLVLGEKVGRATIQGLGFGFLGLLVMTFGGNGINDGTLPALGVAAAVGSAFSYALALVLLRQRATRDAIVTIVALQNFVPGLVLAIPAWLVFVPVAARDVPFFLAIGVLGALGHLLMARAFAKAEAARLAPMEYSALVFAALAGFFAFGEVPGLATLAGSVLIVAGTLLAGRR